jgi:hypothetical protein
VLRAQELFHAAGDNGEETEALDDVMYALQATTKIIVCLPLGIKSAIKRRSYFHGLDNWNGISFRPGREA